MDIKAVFFTAYLWNMLGKLLVRGMGIFSTLILVRILDPSDFGIMALAMMVIGFFVVITDMGVNRYLILLEKPEKKDYDSAWTLNILLRALIVGAILLSSSKIGVFLDSVELEFVLNIIAVTCFFNVFQSIKLVELERNIDFKTINQIQVTAKIFSVTATVSSALYYESYFALLIGNATSTVLMLYLSYRYTRYYPKLNFNFTKQMFTFSFLLIVRNLVGYCRSQVDTLIVGKKFGEAALGEFNISRQFAILPQTEIVGPAMQPAFSLLSTLKKDKKAFMQKIYQGLFLIYSFITPCCIGLFMLAEPFVLTILGEKWSNTIPYIGYLGFLMFPFATQVILHALYDGMAKTKYSMLTDVFGLTAIILLVVFIDFETLDSFILGRVLIGAAALVLSLVLAKTIVGLSFRKMLTLSALPVICSAGLFFSLNYYMFEFNQSWLTLIVNVACGAFVYLGGYFILLKLLTVLNAKGWLCSLLPSPLLLFIKTGNYK